MTFQNFDIYYLSAFLCHQLLSSKMLSSTAMSKQSDGVSFLLSKDQNYFFNFQGSARACFNPGG